MWSSDDDDDVEALPESVTNYDFVCEREEPISFSVLPVQWSEDETFGGGEKQIFLRGIADDGLRKIYKQVIAWKVDLPCVKPEISVLSKDENWIMLPRPRKIFEEIIGSILITVHCLHFIKYHPKASGRLLWDNMSKVFSLYEVSPSQNDLVDHYNFIADVVKREKALSKSKYVLTFLEEKPEKSKVLEQDVQAKSKSSFIVDDTSDEPREDESKEEQDQFDSICSFCDDGGDLLWIPVEIVVKIEKLRDFLQCGNGLVKREQLMSWDPVSEYMRSKKSEWIERAQQLVRVGVEMDCDILPT